MAVGQYPVLVNIPLILTHSILRISQRNGPIDNGWHLPTKCWLAVHVTRHHAELIQWSCCRRIKIGNPLHASRTFKNCTELHFLGQLVDMFLEMPPESSISF